MNSRIVSSDTPEAMADSVASDFQQLIRSLADQPRITIALAGGSTPKLFYSRLAQEPYRSQIPWEKLWFFWGDERCVPKEHPDSNFRMVQEALLSRVPVKPSHVYRLKGEEAPPVAAGEYEKQMREVFRESEWPVFDLMLLGMGPDGHTASLMPDTPALARYTEPIEDRRSDGSPPRWVVHNVVRSLQTVRLTMTLPVLNNARHIWFLVTGAKKANVFSKVQQGPSLSYPASLVHAEDGEIRWYVDKSVIGQPVNG